MILGHPSFARLRAFALDDCDERRRLRIARHLGRCTACRHRVQSIRGIVAAAREPVGPATVPFDAIAARVASGERVLLAGGAGAPGNREPSTGATAGIPRSTHAGARRLAGVATLFIALAAGAVVVGVPEAIAENSELWISPGAPRAGATLELRYRATARLAGEERLVVRARYRTTGPAPRPRVITLGELRRVDDATYEGRVVLPDSATYAVLAVEDAEARYVDDHGQRWEVLVHGEAGRPLLDALRQRYLDVRMRDTRLARETLHEMVALHPDHPAGPYFLFGEESHVLPEEAADSLRSAFLADLPRLEAAVRAGSPPTADEYWYLIMQARALDEPAARDRLAGELIARFPAHGAALQQLAYRAAARHRGNRLAYLAALDSIWRIAPDAADQAVFDGFRAARALGDAAEILRWAERLETLRPDLAPGNGAALIRHQSTREHGMARLRQSIADLASPAERPLTLTRAEYDASRRREAGTYLATLGRALLDAGRSRAALDTLSRALETGWNTELFRTVADTRLQLGDTTGALRSFARLAADPNTSPAFTDSLGARLGDHHVTGIAWDAMVDSARNALRRELIESSLDRAPLRTELRLRDLAGKPTELRLGAGHGITVVAFWSRFCPPSLAELPRLDAVARRLGESGVRIIGVTDDADGSALAAFLREGGYALPTYLDPDRDANNALSNRTTPHYIVLDERGRIRFTSHSAADLARHVAVLGGRWGG